VPWMWVLLMLPRFGGANHASGYNHRSRYCAGVKDNFTGCEIPRWTARKALRRVDLARIEHGKQLLGTSLDGGHSALLPACPVFILAGYTTISLR
jgi:hypothetical protein